MYIFFWLIMGILEAYIFWDIFSCEFEERFERKWYMLIYWGIVIPLNMVISLNLYEVWTVISFLVIYSVATFLFFQGDKRIKLIFLVMFWFMMMFSELMGSIVYAIFKGKRFNTGMEDSEFVWIVMCLVTILYKLIIAKVWVHICGKRRHRVEGKTFMILMSFPAVTCVIGTILFELFFYTPENMQVYIIGIMVLLILMNIVVYYPFEKMSDLLHEQREFELFRLKNDLEQNHYNTIEEIASKQRIYQHDIKQYMAALASLIGRNDNSEAQKLFEQMQIQVNELQQKTYCANGILNALFCEKESQAKSQGVELVLEIEPNISLSFLRETDMIAMFGNLIDNAIRAASQCEKKEVTVRLFEPEGNFVVFIVENPYAGVIKKSGARFLSTKENQEEHGIGLTSVQGLAGKYGGILDIKQEKGYFIVTLSLAKYFYSEKS